MAPEVVQRPAHHRVLRIERQRALRRSPRGRGKAARPAHFREHLRRQPLFVDHAFPARQPRFGHRKAPLPRRRSYQKCSVNNRQYRTAIEGSTVPSHQAKRRSQMSSEVFVPVLSPIVLEIRSTDSAAASRAAKARAPLLEAYDRTSAAELKDALS